MLVARLTVPDSFFCGGTITNGGICLALSPAAAVRRLELDSGMQIIIR